MGSFRHAQSERQSSLAKLSPYGFRSFHSLFELCKCQNGLGWEYHELCQGFPFGLGGDAPVEFPPPEPMEAKASLTSKLFVRDSGLFPPDHEEVADGPDFERKGLVVIHNPCFLDQSGVNGALCKCQKRGFGRCT